MVLGDQLPAPCRGAGVGSLPWRSPGRDFFVFGVALRARNSSKIKFKNYSRFALKLGRTPTAYLCLESPNGEKDSANRAQSSLLELPRCSLSYVNLSKSIQNQTESGAKPRSGLLILGVAWRREIIQKLSSKLIALRAEIDSWRTPKGILNLEHASRGNYSKIKFKN